MTYVQQQVEVRTPNPQVRVNVDNLGTEIERAIQNALSNAAQGGNRGEIREALEAQVRAAVEQARAEGNTIRIGPDGQGITIQRPFDPDNMIPPQAVDISIAFFVAMAFVIVGLPIARAFARRMDRRSEGVSASEITPRLDRIEQAVEAIAIEVERVSEGQRYTTKAIAELRGLPSSNAGWPQGSAREPERVPVGETSRRP
ncbi:MAG TPA: hypothetical protein VFZ73_19005 [Gemmatimonadaceae bacterium]